MTGTRPNLVMIVSDDHATHAISAYGSKLIETPNLDRIAAEGMRFDGCYCTNALCAPSRASILTGTYSHVHGVRTLTTHFDARQPTFVSMLHDAGYQTALVGKWHLGHGGIHDPHGFDRWDILEDQGEYWNPELLSPDGRRAIGGYTTTVLTDLAIARIRERDPTRPFCLLLHHKAPHRSWDPDTVHAGLFADRDLPEPDTLFDDYRGRGRAAQAATMRVGRDLNERDLKAPYPEHLDETGRLLVRYPPLVHANTSTDALASNVDFAQTFLDLAGLPPHPRMQGRNLRPLLAGAGRRPVGWPTALYYRYWEHDDSSHHVPAHFGVRTDRHKLICYYGDGLGVPGASDRVLPPEWELFDLVPDPAELRNVYDDVAYVPIRDTLTAELARLQHALGDTPWPSSPI